MRFISQHNNVNASNYNIGECISFHQIYRRIQYSVEFSEG